MADDKPEPAVSSRPAAAATGSARPIETPPAAAVRHRVPQRQSSRPELTPSPRPPVADRRRSSLISFSSLEDLGQSLTEDIISPGTSRRGATQQQDEVSHWHSTPLAFAILPAVGGMLFKNGSAFVTDILLLGLAAIFMNWSIRLPWDWYFSAQAQLQDVEVDYFSSGKDRDAVETAVESASSAENSPVQSAQDQQSTESLERDPSAFGRGEAAAELRRQEILALCATFIFPVLAAYLLHVIRAQLSSSSTNLVSDYNLTIFLLAAEVRPCRQLVRLVTNRTLHLQRTVTGLDDPFHAEMEEKSTTNRRLAELEAKLADNTIVPQNTLIAQKTDVTDLSAEMKKRYEPRLEGLERAVRRYEKRSTTLAMLTDQRLGQLETRLQDALSLAAVAAQASQKRGPMTRLSDQLAMAIMWPFEFVWRLATSPFRIVEDLYVKMKGLFLGPAGLPSGKRGSSVRNSGKISKSKDEHYSRKAAR